MGKRNNFKKSNEKPNTTKVQAETRVYKKKFTKFSDAVDELREISSVFNKFITNFYPEEEESNMVVIIDDPDELAMKFYDYIREHRFPSIHDKNTRFWSISVASNKMYIKTEFKITFGWQFKYKYDKDAKTTIVDEYEFTISDIGSDETVKENALHNEWNMQVK